MRDLADPHRARGCLLALLVTACTPAAEEFASVGPDDVTIELDAYSGRPNPQWTLTVEESGHLVARLGALSEARGSSLPEAELGYRGFRVRNPGGEGGIPEDVYVSRGGLVEQRQPDGSRLVYEDGQTVEDLLIESARGRGFGEAFDGRAVGQ